MNTSHQDPIPVHILLLHGLGGDRHSLTELARYFKQRVPFSEAQILQGPINFGTTTQPSYGWFIPPSNNRRALDDPQRNKPEGLRESISLIHDQISKLVTNGARSDKIFLFGHSQGGAAAIAAGLTYNRTLGGVLTIAGYLSLDDSTPVAENSTKYRLHHSLHDRNVKVEWSHYARNYILENGGDCEVTQWDIRDDAHGIHMEQVDKICDAIRDLAEPVTTTDGVTADVRN